MTTRLDIYRPGGGIKKVSVVHQGRNNEIRSNLRSSLFGQSGDKFKHVVQIKELVTTLNIPCLTPGVELLRFAGRRPGQPLRRPDGTYSDIPTFLGKGVSQLGVATDHNNIPGMAHSNFVFKCPQVYSVSDFLFHLRNFISRVNTILLSTGWENLDGANQNGLVGGVGNANPARVVVPSDPDLLAGVEPLIELQLCSNSTIALRGTSLFWNNFFLVGSSYFQQITGWPEFMCFDNGLFGVANLMPGGFFTVFNANPAGQHLGTLPGSPLSESVEERLDLVLVSDIPVRMLDRIEEGRDHKKSILAMYDLRGKASGRSSRELNGLELGSDWTLSGPVVCGRTSFSTPQQESFSTVVHKNTLASLNIRAYVRKKVFDSATSTYSIQEFPVLETKADLFFVRLFFTLQL